MYNPVMDAIRKESALINIQLNFDELATGHGTKDFFDKFKRLLLLTSVSSVIPRKITVNSQARYFVWVLLGRWSRASEVRKSRLDPNKRK